MTESKGKIPVDFATPAQHDRIKGKNPVDFATPAQHDRIKGKNPVDFAIPAQHGRIKGKNPVDSAIPDRPCRIKCTYALDYRELATGPHSRQPGVHHEYRKSSHFPYISNKEA
ncbi:hypothetical protein [Paenibacillus ihuae]|uniref:hypothetical protein n=1 Tax=Paenibacillus ihuae TaxID=1232431 RepID=UPI00131DA688|nr:hypothetical protein [Paenibacillus ihuae]